MVKGVVGKNLVTRYLKLQKKKQKVEEEMAGLEKKIADFAKAKKIRALVYGKNRLLITDKMRSVFPAKTDTSRKEFEKMVKQFPEYEQYSSVDIVRLASAYDRKKLSIGFMAMLGKFVIKKPYLKISLFRVR